MKGSVYLGHDKGTLRVYDCDLGAGSGANCRDRYRRSGTPVREVHWLLSFASRGLIGAYSPKVTRHLQGCKAK